jgi:hypothetical protein
VTQLKLRVVCATRKTKESFFTETALGRSLKMYPFLSRVELRLFAENERGLSTVYNQAIEEVKDFPAILIFVHDDVYITDFFWVQRVLEALKLFNVVGAVGNKRRVPKQPGWCFLNENLQADVGENLSGIVGHGKGFPCNKLTFFGPALQEVKLLDGLFLAAPSQTLIDHNLRFDERFSFHFYDLDFCRQVELKELKMGTCAISLVHESTGAFRTDPWRHAYQVYLEKWGE